ncbi:HAMP domain-containing histidine kinase [Clostridium bowmanii]|uniref:sensor histidine kinase n=1 Tax=Clostridium bowmanii TaxID=132925 RepID=UPI001C0DF956|nr:HAMP domain-containing sensor histidine kinase [Clostridium bowmanii]MBU3187999.1 HAMP domain-containing histidine kinase [Clostridium bowmanii]MCA1072178.1 HAMP domain-containing histidine kinase [Clostridium bowmanii]
MNSLRTKLAGSYLLVILITVIIVEGFLIAGTKKYYYKNVESNLSNQLMLSTSFYNTYLASANVKENVANNVDVFYEKINAEVQIIDLDGFVIMDSLGVMPEKKLESNDFIEASAGKVGSIIDRQKYENEGVMTVAYPLIYNGKINGVLRFITSLKKIDDDIYQLSRFFLITGGMVIIISGIVSIFISSIITSPIKKIMSGAEKMASGNFIEKIKVNSDDELGQLAKTLNYMTEEILKSERMKDEFIASVSHELRTPLTSIKGWSIVLNSSELEDVEELKEGLEIIEQESDRLTFLVEDLLDFSKLSSGKVSIKKDFVDLKDILNNIKTQTLPRALKENIHLNLVIDENLPKIFADRNRLKQVFINVLDNSFKFTPDGGNVSIRVNLEGENIVIQIIDTGCGIPKDELPRVKEKFFKGKNANSKNGIGLSICDEIIKLHEGELQINSVLGKGTEVCIIIPV